jgi:hypothetical protein
VRPSPYCLQLGGLLQMPESRPAAKQLASLLNETERTASGVETSIGGRTFILSCMLYMTLSLAVCS